LIDQLVQQHPEAYTFAVSHTTRTPRKKEVHGTDYNFVGRKEFDSMVADGSFFEYSTIHGNLYGKTHKSLNAALGTGKILLLDLHIDTVHHYLDKIEPKPFVAYLTPPAISILEQRLQGRLRKETQGGEPSYAQLADMYTRLRNASNEIQQLDEYNGMVDTVIQICNCGGCVARLCEECSNKAYEELVAALKVDPITTTPEIGKTTTLDVKKTVVVPHPSGSCLCDTRSHPIHTSATTAEQHPQ